MLILTRRVGENIKIGDDVDVTLMAIDGGQVRIGISAPAHIRIDREEIAQKRTENPRHDQARG